MARHAPAVAVPAAATANAAARAAALAAIAWGAFAFGAVYEWAYWPLAAVCLAAGCAALIAGPHRRPRLPGDRALPIALAALFAAVLLQLVPIPIGQLARLSPATDALLRTLDPVYAIGVTRWHALSIDPHATVRALALYGAFALFLLGMTRLFSAIGARGVVGSLSIVGVLVALAGIVQKPLYTGAIYGFWKPEAAGAAFGPFVNKNHFAGWMLMALPLLLALIGVGLQRGWHGVKPDWRHRVLWLSSPEASRLVLLAGGAAIMALALVMTMSRSGMAALALALVLTGWSIVRGLNGRSRKAAGAVYLLLLVVTVVGWVGLDAIVGRFEEADWREYNERRGAWADARSVAAAFPLTGTGLNTYPAASLVYQQHNLTQQFTQAHNDYLQLAAEGGLLLIVPILAGLLLLALSVRRRLREDSLGSSGWWLRRGAVTALVAIGLQEAVEFSLQMPGNAVLFAVVCAIALHRPASEHGHAREAVPAHIAPPERARLAVVPALGARGFGARRWAQGARGIGLGRDARGRGARADAVQFESGRPNG